MKSKKLGLIFTPYGTLVQDHEMFVANILIKTGNDVKFIPLRRTSTPDLIFKNLEWELKSPLGTSCRTIERNLRRATHQSRNIILDFTRISLDEDKCMLYLRNHIRFFHNIKRLLIITKGRRILEMSPKNACIKELPMLE